MCTKNTPLDPFNKLHRPKLLNLCKGFYNPFYYPEVNLDSLKGATFEDICKWTVNNDERNTLTELPSEISNIIQYIFYSCISYSDLHTSNDNEDLFKRISLPHYDKISNQIRPVLQKDFSELSFADLYADCLLEDERSYPLQHMNIFFCKEKLASLGIDINKKELAQYNPSNSLKLLKKILKSHNMTRFETNVLKKNIPGTTTKYSIPLCSTYSLTFVLLAFTEHDIPLEYQYMILSDFVINVCISNKFTPYEILTYLIDVKNGFPKKAFMDARQNLIKTYQKKFYDNLFSKKDSIDSCDNINLFLEFSQEYLKLIECYTKTKRTIDIFRTIEKNILSEETKKREQLLQDETEDEDAIESYKNKFLKLFNYTDNGYAPISSDVLFDFIKNDLSNNTYYIILLKNLESVYSTNDNLLEFTPFYSNSLFNHLW